LKDKALDPINCSEEHGSKVLFWHDVWCGEILLNILFSRPVHDWEVEGISRFFEMLYTLKVRSEGEDKMCWILARKKSFEVKSYYKVLSSPIQSSFPWKSIWKVKVLPRVAFFV
jgi:hypothetical protein